jgi:hypothetical protein
MRHGSSSATGKRIEVRLSASSLSLLPLNIFLYSSTIRRHGRPRAIYLERLLESVGTAVRTVLQQVRSHGAPSNVEGLPHARQRRLCRDPDGATRVRTLTLCPALSLADLLSRRPSLSKPANTLYRHNLTSTLETAIRGSTPPSDTLNAVLRRLDARMLDFEQGQVGWDVFLLEYKVEAPLSTVLDPLSLEAYRSMFKHLWEIKRVEYALNEGWKTLMTNTRLLKRDSGAFCPLLVHHALPY